MDDEHQKHIDELVLNLIVEEGLARNCAADAQMMADEGLWGGAQAMLDISRRHQGAAKALRIKLHALARDEEVSGASGTPATWHRR